MQDKKHTETKKAYQKPEINVIDLAADEVLGIGCKLTTSSGPGPTNITCSAPGPCSSTILS